MQQSYGYPPSQHATWASVKMMIAIGNRSVTRRQYRIYHRHQRVIAKELAKSYADAAIYGIGAYFTDQNGLRHVPMSEVFRD